MAIEFISSLSGSTLVKQNQNQWNHFSGEAFEKLEAEKQNHEQLHKVTEKISSEPSLSSVLRFHENIPLTSTLRTIRIYNETKKPNSIVENTLIDVNNGSGTNIEDSEESSAENRSEEIGKGYYVVTKPFLLIKEKLLPISKEEIIRNRLKEIYNSTNKKDKGGLVNLTF